MSLQIISRFSSASARRALAAGELHEPPHFFSIKVVSVIPDQWETGLRTFNHPIECHRLQGCERGGGRTPA